MSLETIDLVETKKSIMKLTPSKIAKMTEEERFTARIYLRTYLFHQDQRHAGLFGDITKSQKPVESQIEKLL